jgi:uncharacterized protein (DUF362 family)
MTTTSCSSNRRRFLKSALAGGLAAACPVHWSSTASAAGADDRRPARIALTAGDDRAQIVFSALESLGPEIAQAIGNRRVVIKPNNVAIDIQLSATHAGCLEGIVEFLKSIGKLDGAVIAESAANGPTLEGFANYGYTRVAAKYGVKLVDLDQEPNQVLQVFDQRDFRPHPIRMSQRLLDRNTFIISAAKMKTHDLVVTTLSLKNIILGAPVKDPGFAFGSRAKPGAKSDKRIAHGGGVRGLNYNLFALAQVLYPHLAVIDGYDGMEGYGPTRGTAVDHRVCVAGTDWLAADRVAVELMGIDFAKVGYLNYCADAHLGQSDLKKIEIVGEPLARHAKTYKLAPNIEEQLIWMKPAQSG